MTHKPTILIVIPSDNIVATLIESGALSTLNSEFVVRYAISPDVKKIIPGEVEVIKLHKFDSWLGRKLDFHFWNFALFAYLRRKNISASSSFKAMQQRAIYKFFYQVYAHPFLAWIIQLLDTKLFFRADQNVLRLLEKINPSLVIAPGSALDSYSHLFFRSAQKRCIPTLMLVSHWDFFSKKGLFRIAPDKIYVWGEDMKRMALADKTIKPTRIKILGAPQFQKYTVDTSERRGEARTKYGLNNTQKVILFAGTSTPYDELSVLKRLNMVLTEKKYSGTKIIYRPHPRAWKRNYAEEVNLDALANIVLDMTEDISSSSNEHFQNLMAAIDGIVSPFSTMILEAALCGKPALCVSFADEVNQWDFSEANNTEHIKMLKGRSWLDVCRKSADLETSFERFLEKLNDTSLTSDVLEDIKMTVYSDSLSYPDRLHAHIKADFGL